jgi:hypothetical protein
MTSWFGKKVTPKPHQDDGSQTVKALPASWYRSSAMYELERRAIFSRRWLLVSHKARLVNSGDYIRITEANFTFFLIKDRQGQIRAHHNVCRHRAYPLIENEEGHINIIACKYHGKYIIPSLFSMLFHFLTIRIGCGLLICHRMVLRS